MNLPYPEHLLPAFFPPPAGPISGHRPPDAHCDIDQLLADQRAAWDFAQANHLAVLSVNADRNGAYLVIAPSRQLATLFGDECAMVQRKVTAGLSTELWLGSIEHIRVFWRSVTCGH